MKRILKTLILASLVGILLFLGAYTSPFWLPPKVFAKVWLSGEVQKEFLDAYEHP